MRLFSALCALILFASCQKECPTCEAPEECVTCEAPKECKICDDSCGKDLTRGLVAHYPFNGSLNDVSGNGLNLSSVNGAMLGTDFLGRQQSAASFDGLDDYFIAPSSTKFDTDSVSISCVVMVKTLNRRHTLINKINADNVTGFTYGLGQSLASDNKWSFAVPEKTENCSTYATFEPANAIYSSTSIEAGRWYNVVSTFGTNGQRLYIDGKLVAETTRTFNSLKKCSGGNLLIGGWWKNDIISLDGKMDEVRVYNRVISQCEIDELAKTFN